MYTYVLVQFYRRTHCIAALHLHTQIKSMASHHISHLCRSNHFYRKFLSRCHTTSQTYDARFLQQTGPQTQKPAQFDENVEGLSLLRK
jgi:hypothetical protein